MATRRWSSPAPYTYYKAMNRSAHNRVQRYTIATPVAVVVEGNTVGHVPREISRVCWYFQLARNNTITCKVKDKQQRSNIPGKGLEVPWRTMHAAS